MLTAACITAPPFLQAKELKEETGIEVNGDELVELTGRNAVIKMSPGISDEGIKLYLFRKVAAPG